MDDGQSLDINDDFLVAVQRVKVRWEVIPKVYSDDAVEPCDFGHLRHLEVREEVLGFLASQLQVQRVRAKVDFGSPGDCSIIGDASGCEVGADLSRP